MIKDFTYHVVRHDRIGIVGPNGVGKSTFMNILDGTYEPTSGSIGKGETVRIAHFKQELPEFDEDMRVLDYIREDHSYMVLGDGSTLSAGQILERFLFTPELHGVPIRKLSGGERRRLYLLKLLMSAPNVLLLDEPTNDLDIPTLEVLEDFLDSFSGVIVTVCHDRYFLDRVVDKLFVFTGEGHIEIVHGSYSDYKDALVIVTDTANFPRIDGKLFTKNNFLIKIDHHPPLDNYGGINLVNTEVSSCSELIYNFYEYLNEKYDIKLTDEAAKLLYLGIVGDTGRFLFPNTSNDTLRVASELIKYDFNMSKLLDKMEIISDNIMRFRAFIFENYDVYQDGVAFVKVTKEDMDKYGVDPGEVSTGVNLLRSLKDLYAWCFAIDEGNKVRVRIRSKGPVINTLAEKYAGGGHPLASGATVKNWEELDDLLDDMARVVAEYLRENDIKIEN